MQRADYIIVAGMVSGWILVIAAGSVLRVPIVAVFALPLWLLGLLVILISGWVAKRDGEHLTLCAVLQVDPPRRASHVGRMVPGLALLGGLLMFIGVISLAVGQVHAIGLTAAWLEQAWQNQHAGLALPPPPSTSELASAGLFVLVAATAFAAGAMLRLRWPLMVCAGLWVVIGSAAPMTSALMWYVLEW